MRQPRIYKPQVSGILVVSWLSMGPIASNYSHTPAVPLRCWQSNRDPHHSRRVPPFTKVLKADNQLARELLARKATVLPFWMYLANLPRKQVVQCEPMPLLGGNVDIYA